MMMIAAAYLVIATTLAHSGKAIIALPMPDMAACEREVTRVRAWTGAQQGLIGAECINAGKGAP